MIDIHSHVIPFIDDGSSSIEASINILREEISFGITDVICTPHYRKGMFETTIEEVKKNFELLLDAVKKEHLDVRLYLGQEIYLRRVNALKDYFGENVLLSMSNSPYLLLEFSYVNDIDITEVIYNAELLGYKVIVAHIERYQYVDINEAINIKSIGAMIQVNAQSIIGKYGFKIKKKVKKLLDNNLVDFIASDIHESRKNYMDKAYKYIVKKYGIDYAEKVFEKNGHSLIK